MGYAEVRIRSELQKLRREVKEARTRENQIRQGCLGLVRALEEFVTNLEESDALASSRVTELISEARVLLAPVSSGECAATEPS
jgi:hypothetical protein